MAAEAFDSNLTVPAWLDDLRQSVGIILLCLVNLAAHCRLGMPSIKAHHRKAHILQRLPVPRRQGTAFQSDPRNLRRLGFDDLCDGLRRRKTFALPYGLAVAADDAHVGHFLRHVQSDKLLHEWPPHGLVE